MVKTHLLRATLNGGIKQFEETGGVELKKSAK